MAIKDLTDGFITKFKENNMDLIQGFDGNFDQKNSTLIVVVEDIEKPFTTEKVYKIKLVFFGQTFLEFDKSKTKISELFSKVDNLLNSLTKNDLNNITNNFIIGYYRDGQTFESDGEAHTFSFTLTLVINDFNL